MNSKEYLEHHAAMVSGIPAETTRVKAVHAWSGIVGAQQNHAAVYCVTESKLSH